MAKRVVNLSRHEVTATQRDQLAALVGLPDAAELIVHELPAGDPRRQLLQFDLGAPLGPQCTALVESLAVTVEQWNADAIFLVAPDLGAVATAAVAYVHGLAGRFPHLVWRRPAAGGEGFEIAGVLDLAGFRTTARVASL